MIKYTIVIVSGERPEWFSMRWLSACRLLCYFSMTCKSASFHQSQSRLSAEWCVKMTMTTPKDEDGKIWMTSAQKRIHFYVSKKDKSFLYWIQTGFQCLCPSVGHLLVHHNVTCKNACKKKTATKYRNTPTSCDGNASRGQQTNDITIAETCLLLWLFWWCWGYVHICFS